MVPILNSRDEAMKRSQDPVVLLIGAVVKPLQSLS